MKEHGVIRRRVSGPEAAPYMNVARNLLGMVKQQIQFGGLSQLSRTVDLPNGVRITVMSIFGQDEVRISVPAMQETRGVLRHKKHKTENLAITGYTTIGGVKQATLWMNDGDPIGLGWLDPEMDSWATGVSRDGRVVCGNSYIMTNSGVRSHPFRWTRETGMVDIGTLSNDTSKYQDEFNEAYGISDNGEIIVGGGILNTAVSVDNAAWYWTEDVGFKYIDYRGPYNYKGSAYKSTAISRNGEYITGQKENEVSLLYPRMFVWSKATRVIELPGQTINTNYPYMVSNSGVAVGMADDAGWVNKRAVIWSDEGMTELKRDAIASSITGNGQVVLVSDIYPLPDASYLWSQKNGLRQIGRFVASAMSAESEVVVGTYRVGGEFAVKWTAGQEMEYLKPLGKGNSSANAVSYYQENYVDGLEVDEATYNSAQTE